MSYKLLYALCFYLTVSNKNLTSSGQISIAQASTVFNRHSYGPCCKHKKQQVSYLPNSNHLLHNSTDIFWVNFQMTIYDKKWSGKCVGGINNRTWQTTVLLLPLILALPQGTRFRSTMEIRSSSKSLTR